jgi:hypothetical protein
VDAAGNAYVTGQAYSPDFPTANALQPTLGGQGANNAFATKLSADGSTLAYSTYLGGSSSDYGQGIAVDAAGNAYVTGFTTSPDFPSVNPIQSALAGGVNGFVAELTPDGSALVYSTFLGGTGGGLGDRSLSIAVDAAGNAYVTGFTSSADFPTANALQPTLKGSNNAFVTKISQ